MTPPPSQPVLQGRQDLTHIPPKDEVRSNHNYKLAMAACVIDAAVLNSFVKVVTWNTPGGGRRTCDVLRVALNWVAGRSMLYNVHMLQTLHR